VAGRTDGGGQMSIEVRLSVGMWGIYPGTQLIDSDIELRGQ